MEKDSAFSDSDMSQEELCFLPAIPCPDVSEQQDKCVGSSLKLVDSNHSGSPLSEEGGQDRQVMDNAASPEGNVHCHIHTFFFFCSDIGTTILLPIAS